MRINALNSNLIYSSICFLLILVGIIIGQLFDRPDGLSKALGMIANLATIFGVFVAFLALNSWRAQSKHSKIDSLLDELEDNFSMLYRAVHEHRHAQIMITKSEESQSNSYDHQLLQEIGQSKKDKYFKLRDIYSHSFEKLSRHCELDKESVISAFSIARDLVPIFQGLRAIYAKENFQNSFDLLNDNEKALELIWEKCKKEFERLRDKHC